MKRIVSEKIVWYNKEQMRKCKNNRCFNDRCKKRKDQGDFAVAFWKLRVTEQDRKKVTEIWEIILYAVKQIR